MNISLAILFIFISSIFGAFSTLFFKLGASQRINLKNKKLIYAIALAAISFVVYVYALQQAPLTFIYLTGSISYLWVIILARFILQEKINRHKLIGMSLIIMGIIILNFPHSIF